MRQHLTSELTRIETKIEFATYKGSVSAVLQAIEEFESQPRRLQAARRLEQPELDALAQQLETAVSQLQVKLLPRLREEYVAHALLQLPEIAPNANIPVSVEGSDS